jgi:hypothetical protein
MFPRSTGDEDFIERAIAAASRPDVSPIVRRTVIESRDRLRRRLRARHLYPATTFFGAEEVAHARENDG